MNLLTGRKLRIKESDCVAGFKTEFGTLDHIDGPFVDINGTTWTQEIVPNSDEVLLKETVFKG